MKWSAISAKLFFKTEKLNRDISPNEEYARIEADVKGDAYQTVNINMEYLECLSSAGPPDSRAIAGHYSKQ